MERRFTRDPDRPRPITLAASGEDCRDGGGDGVGPLVSELALSTTEGDLEGSPGAGALPESFSSALMRWEMLDPSLELLGRRSAAVCCWEAFGRYAAPDEADLVVPTGASSGAKKELRTGFDAVREKRGAVKPSGPIVALLEL
jgi:hypothetical protein